MTGDKAAVPAVDSTTNALHALTPKYDEKQHAIYLAALDATLSNKDIKNIALTGGYGTGKSSILRKFADENRKRVIEISLSTLGFDGSTDDDVETSLIQKEIVKQLLYRLAPHRSVGSRFQRIGRFRFGPAAGVAAGLGLAITFVSLFAGWTQKLSNLVNAGAAAFGAISFDIGLWIQPIVWGVYSLAVLALVAAFHNRIQIPRVKAGDFEVTLSRDGTSYFDKYLDEIVYYFENDKKRDIVVLEDIDRFDNPHIFETLRALNTLLNAASQLRPRVIRFVYAMKDSIFIDLGRSDPEEDSEYGDASPDEAAQANRTKFFDLVIPVVPFITHANARNLIDTELGVLKDELDPRVIDIAARHITDMRLIKNVRNEYVIFKQKVLISDEGKQLDLSKSALFAMMLYKGIHLEDFEKIKPGDSRLDDLYREYRQIVNFTRQRLTAEIQQARRELRDLSTVDGRGARAGVALQSYIAGVRRQLAAPDRPPTTISLNGVDRTPDIETSGFWRDLVAGDAPLLVTIAGGRAQLNMSKSDTADIVGEVLDSVDTWDAGTRKDVDARLARLTHDRDELLSGDMDVLISHDDYVSEEGGPLSASLDALGPLAASLIAAGFIGRDFALYTSTYYSGRVSTEAQNFILRCVSRQVSDLHFVLTADDARAVIAEQGDSVLRERGMYNLSVLDYLLADRVAAEGSADFYRREKQADAIVAALAAAGADELETITAYLAEGQWPDALVARITRLWGGILQQLLGGTLDDAAKTGRLVDVALRSLAARRTYPADGPTLQALLDEHGAQVSVLTDPSLTADAADRIAQVLRAAKVKLQELSSLGPELRRAAVDSSAFVLTRPNLEAIAADQDIALDRLRSASQQAYEYVLANGLAYFEVLAAREGAVAVRDPGELSTTVSDVAEKAPDMLANVLDSVTPTASVPMIANVPESVWAALASRGLFPSTFENVVAYIGGRGAIDAELGLLLNSSRAISIAKEVAQADRVVLAAQVLAAEDALPDPSIRVEIVRHLGLDDTLPLTSVPPEKGQLLGLLVEASLLPDDAATFAHAPKQDWPTREFLIGRSSEFGSYMSPTELPVADLPRLMASTVVPRAIKQAVLDRADEFAPGSDRAALTAIATYAVSITPMPRLPVALVTRLAESRVAVTLVVRLLQPILDEVTEPQLVAILVAMGGDYAAVSARNGRRRNLPRTDADRALVGRLEVLEIASSSSETSSQIRVNLRRR